MKRKMKLLKEMIFSGKMNVFVGMKLFLLFYRFSRLFSYRFFGYD